MRGHEYRHTLKKLWWSPFPSGGTESAKVWHDGTNAMGAKHRRYRSDRSGTSTCNIIAASLTVMESFCRYWYSSFRWRGWHKLLHLPDKKKQLLRFYVLHYAGSEWRTDALLGCFRAIWSFCATLLLGSEDRPSFRGAELWYCLRLCIVPLGNQGPRIEHFCRFVICKANFAIPNLFYTGRLHRFGYMGSRSAKCQAISMQSIPSYMSVRVDQVDVKCAKHRQHLSNRPMCGVMVALVPVDWIDHYYQYRPFNVWGVQSATTYPIRLSGRIGYPP